jgi:hypothetical protein
MEGKVCTQEGAFHEEHFSNLFVGIIPKFSPLVGMMPNSRDYAKKYRFSLMHGIRDNVEY